MRYVRLKVFLIISSVLHIMVLFIVAVFFQPRGIVAEPQLIQVGTINEYKKPGVASSKSPKEPPKPGKKEIISQKEVPKPEKKIPKLVIKKKHEIAEKKEAINQINESAVEQSKTEPSQDTKGESDQKTEPLSTTIAGIGSSKGGKGVSSEGSGQGGELAYPDYKTNPKPKYPMIARSSGYKGTVLLKVLVLKSGKVGKVELEKSSSYGIFDKSAIEAVKNWIFIPGKRDGVPISSWVEVPIRFELNSG
jgi:periplasmic protein TonB